MSCKSAKGISCPENITGMSGKKCEDLNENECQFMMTQYGCCYHGSKENQGDVPPPTNNSEDWLECSNERKYIKYKENCYCNGEGMVICDYIGEPDQGPDPGQQQQQQSDQGPDPGQQQQQQQQQSESNLWVYLLIAGGFILCCIIFIVFFIIMKKKKHK